MVALLVALLCVFAVITVRDVRYRLVYGEDLLFLVALRLLAAAGSLFPDASGLAPAQWGFQVLGTQMPASLLVAVLLAALGALVSKLLGATALGRGDVLLLAACCLFIAPSNLEAYLLLVPVFGIALALFWLIARKDKTFPFALALVWPCWLDIFIA